MRYITPVDVFFYVLDGKGVVEVRADFGLPTCLETLN